MTERLSESFLEQMMLAQSVTHSLPSSFLLHRNHVVILMFAFTAQQADAHPIVSAKQLQQPLVLLADPLLQVLHWVHQLVPHQRGNPLVGLQVDYTVRGQTHQAGLHGPQLFFDAHVTHHHPAGCTDASTCWDFSPLYLDRNLLHGRVGGDLRPDEESLIAHWAVAELTLVPVIGQATPAEVVTTWRGDWVSEDIPADGTLKIIPW